MHLTLSPIIFHFAHGKGQLFTLHSFLDVEGKASSSPSLHVPSEQLVAIYTHISVVGIVWSLMASSQIKVKMRVKIRSILFEIDFSNNIFILLSYLAYFS